ncbi:MAG: chromosome partitioning ATPase, partial [Massilia sp.]|nr:chromosome partitioning ATPase [Massilia sp.]
MSIIEKAASRIDQKREASAVVAPGAAPGPLAAAPAVAAMAVTAPEAALAAPTTPEVTTPAAVAVTAPEAATPATTSPAAATPATATPVKEYKHGTRRVELDLNRMRDMGMVTAAGGRTLLVEDFRIIKRPLLKRAFAEHDEHGRPGNLIMITSSLPGEGKTYCAINLAMSIAMELDHTVLLIDADVARSSVLRTLGLAPGPGLMDLLLDDTLDLADVMLRTNV